MNELRLLWVAHLCHDVVMNVREFGDYLLTVNKAI